MQADWTLVSRVSAKEQASIDGPFIPQFTCEWRLNHVHWVFHVTTSGDGQLWT